MNLPMLFLGAGICVTAGDLVLAQWARASNWIYLALGLFLNLIGIIFYANTLRIETVGVATAVFLGLNIVAVALCGFLVFGENVSLMSFLGTGLLILSIFLIYI